MHITYFVAGTNGMWSGCVQLCLNRMLREREREIHYVHSASLAYEDGIMFMSEPFAARQ